MRPHGGRLEYRHNDACIVVLVVWLPIRLGKDYSEGLELPDFDEHALGTVDCRSRSRGATGGHIEIGARLGKRLEKNGSGNGQRSDLGMVAAYAVCDSGARRSAMQPTVESCRIRDTETIKGGLNL
jgi:hypothetical protein